MQIIHHNQHFFDLIFAVYSQLLPHLGKIIEKFCRPLLIFNIFPKNFTFMCCVTLVIDFERVFPFGSRDHKMKMSSVPLQASATFWKPLQGGAKVVGQCFFKAQ